MGDIMGGLCGTEDPDDVVDQKKEDKPEETQQLTSHTDDVASGAVTAVDDGDGDDQDPEIKKETADDVASGDTAVDDSKKDLETDHTEDPAVGASDDMKVGTEKEEGVAAEPVKEEDMLNMDKPVDPEPAPKGAEPEETKTEEIVVDELNEAEEVKVDESKDDESAKGRSCLVSGH